MTKKMILIGALAGLAWCSNLRAADTTTAPATPAASPSEQAATPEPPKKADPDINQRMADVEAYISNGARGSDAADAKVTSKLDGVPGPGHNAWMMTSAALVLFMTLPGLALFY